jgi:hypothetical protein
LFSRYLTADEVAPVSSHNHSFLTLLPLIT